MKTWDATTRPIFFDKITIMKYIIGIDEVGRGSLAGPVVVAGVLISAKENLKKFEKKLKTPLRDSKKLSGRQRDIWTSFAVKNKIRRFVSFVNPRKIDRINISEAVNLAAGRIVSDLISKNRISPSKILVMADAGIKPKTPKLSKMKFRSLIGGDNLIPAISLASIIAKTKRDGYMVKLHKKFPVYGFDRNKGYGTKKHINALKAYGPCSVHRLTFIKKYSIITHNS